MLERMDTFRPAVQLVLRGGRLVGETSKMPLAPVWHVP